MKRTLEDLELENSRLLKKISDLEEQLVALKSGDGNTSEKEKTRAEEELRKSEDWRRALLESIIHGTTDVVFVKDIQGRYLLLNASVERIAGKCTADILGKDDYFLFLPHEAKAIMEGDRKVIESGLTITFEEAVTGADGVPRTYLSTKGPLFDANNSPIGLFGISREITGRKQVEKALQQSEEMFRSFIETANEFMYITDGKMYFTYVNDAMVKALGYSREELTSMNVTHLLTKEEKEKCFNPRYQELVTTGKLMLEDTWITKNEKEIRGEICAIAVYDNDHNFAGARAIFHDITERKKAEEALQEGEQRFRKMAELLPLTIFEADLNGMVTYVNQTGFDIFGYSQQDFVEGLDMFYMLIPEDRGTAKENIRKRLKGEISGANEYTALTKHGNTFPVIVTTNLILKDGKPAGFRGVVTDITERKRVEEALRESEEIFKRFMEYSPIYVFFKDENIRSLRLSKNYEKMLGKPIGELLGKNMYDLFPSVLAESMVADDMRILKEEKEIAVEEEFNGRFYSTIKFPIFIDRKPRYLAGYTIDITDHKKAEEALRDSREELQRYLEIMESMILVLDAKSMVAMINRKGCDILGYERHEIEGKKWFDNFVPESLRAAMIERHAAIMRGEIDAASYFETPVLTKSGGERLIAWHKSVLKDSSGRIIGTISSCEDITERKRAEEQKAKLEAQLQQAQKMESVGRLAGGVAHDFNNMLSVILGHAELALLHTDPAQQIHANLRAIRNAAVRSADLTRQLLAFARKQIVAPKALNLNKAVESMLKMLQRLIGENIQINWQPGVNLWRVKVDPSQIDQILANLCVNARDAITDAGKIIIETGNSILDQGFCAFHAGVLPGEYVRLAISDTGCGMDKETLGKIFEPFFTTKGIGEGTGLGLATVHGAVTQNNGFINVYSEPGVGTTFTIYLPRLVDTSGEPRTEDATGPAMRGWETILLVEDEAEGLEISKAMLELQGYTVLASSVPSEAIALARDYNGEIHLLLTDVVMPGMNGRELAEILTSLNPRLRRLYMSGYTADLIAHHGVLDEGVNFIQKPFLLKDLAARVRETLDSK